MQIKSFQPGKTYSTRSICDSEQIIKITVASRTAHTIKTTEGKTLRVGIYDGAEYVKPWGSYSMAPIIRATGEVEGPDPLEVIAKEHLGLETLETRNNDREDFRDLAVWQIKAALQAAYDAGKASR